MTNMKHILPLIAVTLLAFSSCRVEFSPNAPWRDVPSVYCVLDPEEDTVWVRLQRCYLGEDNLYNYSSIADSNYYLPDAVSVHLLAWKGIRGDNNSLTASENLVDRWQLAYTEREGKPEGNFPSGRQPVYYCVPGDRMLADTDCVFQLVIIRNADGDTLATASTSMVGFLPKKITYNDTIEEVLTNPNALRGHEFGFIIGCRGRLQWNTLPRGRLYQPFVTFYYKKLRDTLHFTIPGTTVKNPGNAISLSCIPFTQDYYFDYIRRQLSDNTDSLFTVNNVDITIAVCNEDLNAYITSLDHTVMGGQDNPTYSNIKGGVGIFGSRRSHIVINMPCDSVGKPGYIPDRLYNLGVGFYGHFSQNK